VESCEPLADRAARLGKIARVIDIATGCGRYVLVVTIEPAGGRVIPVRIRVSRECWHFAIDALMGAQRERRAKRPAGSYTAKLFDGGLTRSLKKIGEEATDIVVAAQAEGRKRTVSEITDLVFHLCVLMTELGIDWSDIGDVLTSPAHGSDH
jgi:phosphoribosyl-ATP pyrophosphohydrolase/phosphoribosyl-AMP cyclohydrolase